MDVADKILSGFVVAGLAFVGGLHWLGENIPPIIKYVLIGVLIILGYLWLVGYQDAKLNNKETTIKVYLLLLYLAVAYVSWYWVADWLGKAFMETVNKWTLDNWKILITLGIILGLWYSLRNEAQHSQNLIVTQKTSAKK